MNSSLGTDSTRWSIGPYHPQLPGPLKISLQLDGEIISGAKLEGGFLHRGLEKTFELHHWQSAITYADHVDPENAIFGETALCLAVEEIGEINVSPRAQTIRLIAMELGRIQSHLAFIGRYAKVVGSETMFHYVSRDREKILDLFELLTGARFTINFLRFGGVSMDVTEGFIERVLEVCELIRVRLKEYNDLFSYNHVFLRRSVGTGLLTKENAIRHGVTGPSARAAGIPFDLRLEHPYSRYDTLDFKIVLPQDDVGTVGDCHSRYLLRLREISQSIGILKEAVDKIAPGEFEHGRPGIDFRLKPGEAYGRVESPRGILGCHVVSDGGNRPVRVQFRTPTTFAISTAPDLLTGEKLEDLPSILASLDINVAEADR